MPYDPQPINLDQKFQKFSKHWSPHIVAQLNDLHVKAAKVQGAFVWHRHEDTDELFLVHKGTLTIQYRDRDVVLREGEMHVVPKGVEHQPGRRRRVPDPFDRARGNAEHRRCRRRPHGARGAVDLSRTMLLSRIDLDGLGKIVVVRIVADDLTGALDTAAPFAAASGPLPVRWDRTTQSGSCALDTETREQSTDAYGWVDHFRGATLPFKKIDSLLRGRTAQEIVACLKGGRFRSAIIAPAFRRRTGSHGWGGNIGARQGSGPGSRSTWTSCSSFGAACRSFMPSPPRHSRPTDFSCATPRPSSTCTRSSPQADAWRSRSCGAAAPASPAPWPGRRAPSFRAHKPPADADRQRPPSLARAAGRARALTGPARAAPRSTDRATIADAVAGVADMIGRGSTSGLGLALPEASPETARAILATTFELVALQMPRPGNLLVTGGETLYGLLQALGASSLLATGELMPGVPHARVVGGRWHDLTVIAKSGGFGAPDLLIRLAESVMP